MATPITSPKGFVQPIYPVLAGGDGQFLQNSLDNVSKSIQSLLVFAPCAASQPPTSLGDGMLRLARSPWNPIAGITDPVWVYYDAPSASWVKLLP